MSFRSARITLAALALPLGTALAQDPIPSVPALGSTDVPRLEAEVRTEPLRIDGSLSDEAWADAAVATGFVQGEPVEGAPVEQPTEVRVLYDDRAIYIGARMYDSDPESIARQLVRRDERGQYDVFEVSLDTNADRRTGYRFGVTAAGVQLDSYLFNDVDEDDSWDAVWESEVQRDSLGWTAELRIPLSQLRFQPSSAPQTWGVNFARRRVASNERSYFALESRQRRGRVSVFARLTGLALTEGVARLELRPYVLANGRTSPPEPGNPFFSGSGAGAAAGVDLRYGLGSAFTLDMTLNPDFGQVEVDPAVINLSAFETFYDERRPFFVEDARIFDFNLSGGNNSLFYSRRIGREPQLDDYEDADYLDVPQQTSILGAAKLTGRTEGGLSIGALAAVTEQEEGRAAFDGSDDFVTFLAEPRTDHAVVRLEQDLLEGGSQVGGIVTALNRHLPADGSFDFLPSTAYNAGVDFEHSWGERVWRLWGFVAGSHVRGDPEAITAIQRSSNHYFQRPDAYDLAVDSAATSMTGLEWRLQMEKQSGEHWTGAVWAAQRSPGFDVNDLGYFQGSERLDGGARIQYQDITPGEVLRDYEISAFTFHNWRHEALRDAWSIGSWGHAHKSGSFNASADATFLNYWDANLGASYSPEVLVDVATRGGPLMIRPASTRLSFRGSTDRRSRVSVEPSGEVSRSDAGALSWDARLELSVRPHPQVELEMEPSYESEEEAAQYVTTTGVLPYAPTFGRRYVFGELDRRTFSLDTRLNVTFTPHLTLQLFVQPLLSVGDFSNYKQLTRGESFEFDELAEGDALARDGAVRCVGGRTCVYDERRYIDFDDDGATELSFGDRDFRVRSLRGNAVFRWEYRPGSTLYLVWQQQRSYEDLIARGFDVLGESLDLLTDPPSNVFIVKLNYWLSL